MMRYEVVLIAQNPMRCVTTRLSASDVQDLAEKLLAEFPGLEFIKARELPELPV